MMPLCDALGITVNELLSGERLSEQTYQAKAEENMVRLMREKYSYLAFTAVISVLSAVFVVCLSSYLSLRVTSAQATWLGNADMKMDGGGFLMNMLYFLVPVLLFGAVQGFISAKANGRLFQYVPLALTVCGLLFCMATYLSLFGTGSPSVIAENRYFAIFLSIPVSGAFVGCLAGMVTAKFIRR